MPKKNGRRKKRKNTAGEAIVTTVSRGRPVVGAIYKDAGGKWRWRMRHGQKTASPNEHFYSKSNSIRAIKQMVNAIRTRPFILVEE